MKLPKMSFATDTLIDSKNFLSRFFKLQSLRDGSFLILIWLSKRYDSTMLQNNQNANGPIRVYNLMTPRQPNWDKKESVPYQNLSRVNLILNSGHGSSKSHAAVFSFEYHYELQTDKLLKICFYL